MAPDATPMAEPRYVQLGMDVPHEQAMHALLHGALRESVRSHCGLGHRCSAACVFAPALGAQRLLVTLGCQAATARSWRPIFSLSLSLSFLLLHGVQASALALLGTLVQFAVLRSHRVVQLWGTAATKMVPLGAPWGVLGTSSYFPTLQIGVIRFLLHARLRLLFSSLSPLPTPTYNG